jgi:hypothetical protein
MSVVQIHFSHTQIFCFVNLFLSYSCQFTSLNGPRKFYVWRIFNRNINKISGFKFTFLQRQRRLREIGKKNIVLFKLMCNECGSLWIIYWLGVFHLKDWLLHFQLICFQATFLSLFAHDWNYEGKCCRFV